MNKKNKEYFLFLSELAYYRKSLALRKSNGRLLIGSGLVNTVVISLILLSLSFTGGLGLAFWQFPVALSLSLWLNYLASRHLFIKDHRRVSLRTSAAIPAVIGFSIFISGFFYDISSDGQMYHMEPKSLALRTGEKIRHRLNLQ